MEMAPAVVGLVGVGTHIYSLLGQFISGCVNAPDLVRNLHHEINDFNFILSLLQPLLLESPLNQSRASMIYVDQLALILAGCVCTLSELEKEAEGVNRLKSSGKIRVWDRLKWSRIEPTISQLSQRLQSYKPPLTLILTILTSPSLTEATNCSVTLRGQLEGIPHMPSPGQSGSTLATSGDYTSSGSTAAGPGSAVDHLDPAMVDSGSTVDSDSATDGSESTMTVSDTRVVNFYRLACESILFTTRPYRGRSNNSVISVASSQRPKPSWSLMSGGSNRSVLSLPVSDYEFSGISLAEASDVSTLPLPISADKLGISKWYGSKANDTAPSSPISTCERGGLLRLFASRNKILPTSPHLISLHQAAKLGQMVSVKLLLEQGADIEEKDDSGNTALHIAARNNCGSVVGLLLDRGADIEAKGLYGGTPLYWAAREGHDSTVGLLLDRGADMKAKGQDGFTPLHNAACNGHDSTVGLLLDWGADKQAITKNGETPSDLARLGRYSEIYQLLQEDII